MRRGTNHFSAAPTSLDSIEFFQKCHWKNPANYSDLYLKKGLSAAQIGEKLGIPKQTVLNQLKREGIRLGTNKGRLANPDNYRLAYAPYGFAKKDGKLVTNKSELKICRMVVQLRNNSKMSFHEIARELERRRIKGRTNSVSWTPRDRRSHLQTMEWKTITRSMPYVRSTERYNRRNRGGGYSSLLHGAT